MLLALLLSTALVMLLNIAAAAALNERGINALATPIVIVLSGNLLPLALLPDTWQMALLMQPLAGVLDIPVRLYSGSWPARGRWRDWACRPSGSCCWSAWATRPWAAPCAGSRSRG